MKAHLINRIQLTPQEIRLLTDGWVCGRNLIERIEQLPEKSRPMHQMFILCAAVAHFEQFLLTVATPVPVDELAEANPS